MPMKVIDDMQFYGTVTVGERGQVAIPQEARDALGIAAGDKMMVISGIFEGSLVIVPHRVVTDVLKKSYTQALSQLLEGVNHD
jgi:AbrB family looped-hinge helix DNA binding protein